MVVKYICWAKYLIYVFFMTARLGKDSYEVQ